MSIAVVMVSVGPLDSFDLVFLPAEAGPPLVAFRQTVKNAPPVSSFQRGVSESSTVD